MAVPETHVQAQLSVVFLNAVASVAGLTVQDKTAGGDFGTDCTISFVQQFEGMIVDTGVLLAIQLKATKNFTHENGVVKYTLSHAAWRRLMAPCSQDKLLVVLTMPRERERWLTCSHDNLLLERSAYFIRNTDIPDFGTNTTSKVIDIPEANLLTPEALLNLVQPGLAKLEQTA